MSERIIVINPNSTVAVTESMDAALDPFRQAGGPEIECVTNPHGPPGIESQQHVDDVSAHIRDIIRARDNEASAFVVACFSDPGMFAAREVTRKPVFGIAESGILALSLGSRFGILAILGNPFSTSGMSDGSVWNPACCGSSIGLDVVELSDETRTFSRLSEVGGTLRDEHGADVLVLGCAGMARCRARLRINCVAVVDPSQAVVGVAVTAIGWARPTPLSGQPRDPSGARQVSV